MTPRDDQPRGGLLDDDRNRDAHRRETSPRRPQNGGQPPPRTPRPSLRPTPRTRVDLAPDRASHGGQPVNRLEVGQALPATQDLTSHPDCTNCGRTWGRHALYYLPATGQFIGWRPCEAIDAIEAQAQR